MSDPAEGPILEWLALALSIAAGAAYAAVDEAVSTVKEVRLMSLRDEGGTPGRVAARLLDQRSLVQVRFQTGRALCLVIAVGLTVRLMEAVDPPWLVAPAVAGLGVIFATLSVGAGALARGRADRWTVPLVRWLRPLELFAAPLRSSALRVRPPARASLPAPAERRPGGDGGARGRAHDRAARRERLDLGRLRRAPAQRPGVQGHRGSRGDGPSHPDEVDRDRHPARGCAARHRP